MQAITAQQVQQLRALASMGNPLPNGLTIPRRQSVGQVDPGLAQQIEQLLNPEVWTMFDTALISPSTASGVNSTNVPFANFTNVTQQVSFFNQRTQANSPGLTSMTTTSGYVDLPYKAYGCGIEVWCDTDAASGAGSQFSARQFVESVVQGATFILSFSTDQKLFVPVADMPAGGGCYYGVATDSRATGANQTAGSATNGFPGVQSRTLWKDYILFKDKQPFSCLLQFNPVAIARLNALTAMTGNQSAGIKPKFWGYRGKQLVMGGPLRG